jgi:hypothetical protein
VYSMLKGFGRSLPDGGIDLSVPGVLTQKVRNQTAWGGFFNDNSVSGLALSN